MTILGMINNQKCWHGTLTATCFEFAGCAVCGQRWQAFIIVWDTCHRIIASDTDKNTWILNANKAHI